MGIGAPQPRSYPVNIQELDVANYSLDKCKISMLSASIYYNFNGAKIPNLCYRKI